MTLTIWSFAVDEAPEPSGKETIEFGVGVGVGFVAEFCLQAPKLDLEFTSDGAVGRA